MSLVGSAKRYPMPGAGGRSFTLEDRIARCFTHSLSGKAPDPASPEAKALVAYLTSISAGPAASPPARARFNTVDPVNIVPIAQLNAARGRMKYDRYCSGCHGLDGQGYRERRTPLPYDYVPPVWGPRSYDNAAGLARVYTLAGFVRHAMPWDEPGEVNDLDAQEIAAFVDGQPRPDFPDKGAGTGRCRSTPSTTRSSTRRTRSSCHSTSRPLEPQERSERRGDAGRETSRGSGLAAYGWSSTLRT